MTNAPIDTALLTGSWEEFYHGYANESLSVYYVKDTSGAAWLLFVYYYNDEVAPVSQYYGISYDRVSLQAGENSISGLALDRKDHDFVPMKGRQSDPSTFCLIEIESDKDELTIHCTIENQRFRLLEPHQGEPKIFEHYTIDIPGEEK